MWWCRRRRRRHWQRKVRVERTGKRSLRKRVRGQEIHVRVEIDHSIATVALWGLRVLSTRGAWASNRSRLTRGSQKSARRGGGALSCERTQCVVVVVAAAAAVEGLQQVWGNPSVSCWISTVSKAGSSTTKLHHQPLFVGQSGGSVYHRVTARPGSVLGHVPGILVNAVHEIVVWS